MSRANILKPLRLCILPRPAIQAWRSARCFATEVSSSASTIPAVATSSVPTSAKAPIRAAQQSIIATGGSTTGIAADAKGSDVTAALKKTSAAPVKRGPVGVVVSIGKMQKTVKVRVPGQKYNKHLRKYFRDDTNHLVRDENGSLNIGDVVALTPYRTSKHVKHTIQEILVPFGTPIEDRPHVPTEKERTAAYRAKRKVKLERRTARRVEAQMQRESANKLKAMGSEELLAQVEAEIVEQEKEAVKQIAAKVDEQEEVKKVRKDKKLVKKEQKAAKEEKVVKKQEKQISSREERS